MQTHYNGVHKGCGTSTDFYSFFTFILICACVEREFIKAINEKRVMIALCMTELFREKRQIKLQFVTVTSF